MRENFTNSALLVFKSEGGYTVDRGGPTNFGVTLGTLKAVGKDINGDGKIDIADTKSLTLADAQAIYRQYYWKPCGGDDLPKGVDYAVFDFAVNSGTHRAVQTLQDILSAVSLYSGKIDGWFGPKTAKAVSECASAHGAGDLIDTICDARLAFVRKISGPQGWSVNGHGWSNRIAFVRMQAKRMTRDIAPRPTTITAPEQVSAPAIPSDPNPYLTPESVAGFGGIVASTATGMSAAFTPGSPLTWALAFAMTAGTCAVLVVFWQRVKKANERV